MDIRQLRYFVTIVEEGTISAAARKLNIAQPPLSMQIRQMEDEYHVILFERGARQITLTDAGRLLFRYAQQILELTDVAEDDLRTLSTGRSGTVRLGLVSSCDCDELYKNIRYFHTKSPDVRFSIREGNTFELLEALHHGQIELAVIRTPFSGSDLEYTSLRMDQMCAAGQSRYLNGFSSDSPEGILVSELETTPLILYRRWEKIIRTVFEHENTIPNILTIADDARTCLQWATAGLGVALVPEAILHYAPDLSAVRLREDAFSSQLCLTHKKDSTLSESAAAFYRIFNSNQ